MSNKEITIEEIKEKFEDNDIQPSYHRLRIYQYLYSNFSHPTVDEIYNALTKEIPTLSKTTIYTTLKLLISKGLIREMSLDENEMRYEARLDFHAHFKCTECGRVYDVKNPCSDSLFLETKEIEGHKVNEVRIYFKGICRNCRKNDR